MTGLERGSRYEFRVFVSNIAGRKREPASKEFNVISGDDDEGPGPGNGCSYYFVPLLLLLPRNGRLEGGMDVKG